MTKTSFPITFDLVVRDEATASMNAVYQVMREGKGVSEETTRSFKEFRSELLEQRRAQSTVVMAWKEQHQTMYESVAIMQGVASMGRTLTNVYNTINIAAIRVGDAQQRYNDAVKEFGKDSPQAKKALDDLREAQEKQNQAIFSACLTLPSLAASFLNMIPHLLMLKTSLVGATIAQHGLNLSMLANPIMLIVLAIVLLVGWIYHVTKGFKDWTGVMEFFKKVGDLVFAAVKLWYDYYLKPMIDAILYFVKLIQDAIDALEKLAGKKVPSTGGGGGGGGGGEGGGGATTTTTTAFVSSTAMTGITGGIRRGQLGGVFTEPTLTLLGEAGAEAVIPLERVRLERLLAPSREVPTQIVLQLDAHETRDLLEGRAIVRDIKTMIR